jgi:uncharacterized membrane protein YfcA
MVTAAAVIGAVIGGRLTAVFKPDALRIAFGWAMLLMAAVVLAQETAPAVGIAMAAGTVVAAVTYLTSVRQDAPRMPELAVEAVAGRLHQERTTNRDIVLRPTPRDARNDRRAPDPDSAPK